jgi:copper resistance protein C
MTMPIPVTAHRSGLPNGYGRPLTRLVVVLMLLLVTGVGMAGPASAHNILTSSDPTEGSTLQAAPTSVRLTFDQPVQDFEPVITVLGPDGQRYESGTPKVDSTVVTTTVGALPSAGAYTIAYRIVSADGHPVEGQIRFELAAGASGISAGAAAGTTGAASASTAPDSSSGLSVWVWAAIALAAILVIAAIFVIVRRPRGSE